MIIRIDGAKWRDADLISPGVCRDVITDVTAAADAIRIYRIFAAAERRNYLIGNLAMLPTPARHVV